MKAYIILAAVLIAISMSGCGHVNKEIIEQTIPEKEVTQWGPWTENDLNRVVDYYKDDINEFFFWVWQNIGYCEDPNGELNTPLKVLNARKGSCVGHALLYEYFCKRNGIECVVIDIYGLGYAHCGCVVPSTMQWFSAHERVAIELESCDIPQVARFVGRKIYGVEPTGYGYYEDKEYIKL